MGDLESEAEEGANRTRPARRVPRISLANQEAMALRRQEEDEEACGATTAAAALRAPAHVIARVFSQLDCVDLLSCSLVCRQWYRDSTELREEWRKEYLEAWNLQGLNIKRETQPPCPTCSIRSLRNLCP